MLEKRLKYGKRVSTTYNLEHLGHCQRKILLSQEQNGSANQKKVSVAVISNLHRFSEQKKEEHRKINELNKLNREDQQQKNMIKREAKEKAIARKKEEQQKKQEEKEEQKKIKQAKKETEEKEEQKKEKVKQPKKEKAKKSKIKTAALYNGCLVKALYDQVLSSCFFF
jgi:hypothetical protein